MWPFVLCVRENMGLKDQEMTEIDFIGMLCLAVCVVDTDDVMRMELWDCSVTDHMF